MRNEVLQNSLFSPIKQGMRRQPYTLFLLPHAYYLLPIYLTPHLLIKCMLSNKISRTEVLILGLVVLILLAGFVLVFTNVPLFERYTVEDGLVEWLTVLGLLLASFTCFNRVIKLRRQRSFFFLLAAFGLGLLLFFGAGEEVSWGQRMLGVQSPEYFKENNSQGETNIHNLIVDGIRLNRVIFSFLFTIVLGSYVIILPILYRTKEGMKRFVYYWGIPLPKPYQVIGFILLFGLTELVPHEKRAELLEGGTGFFLYLIIAYPANAAVFKKDSIPK